MTSNIEHHGKAVERVIPCNYLVKRWISIEPKPEMAPQGLMTMNNASMTDSIAFSNVEYKTNAKSV